MAGRGSILLGMLCAFLAVGAALWLRLRADEPPAETPLVTPPATAVGVPTRQQPPDDAELRRLRARIAELEAQLVEGAAREAAPPEDPVRSEAPAPATQPDGAPQDTLPAAQEPETGSAREQAERALQRLADGLSSEMLEDAALWQLLTRLHLLAGDPEAAMASLAESFRRAPDDDFFSELVGEIPVEIRLAGLQALLVDFPEHDELWGDLAATYRESDNPEQAFASYLRAFEADPRDSEWSEKLVELDPLQAASLLERRLGEAGDDDELLGNLADAYRGSERVGDAYQTYRRAHELDPSDKEWLRRMSELRPAESLEALQAAIANEPGDHEVWNLLGGAQHRLGNRRAAGDAYLEALDRRPRDGEAIAGLAQVDPERALDWLASRQAEAPDNDEIWGDMGDAHLQAGRSGEALRCYQQAARLDPRDSEWPPKIAELAGD